MRHVVDLGIALGPLGLYSMSRCRHSQRNWDAGRSTASSNHCFMVSSRRGRKAFHHRSDSASTPEMFRGSFSGLSVLKFILFQSKSSSNAQQHQPRRFAIPETETAYIIHPRTIVVRWCISRIILQIRAHSLAPIVSRP